MEKFMTSEEFDQGYRANKYERKELKIIEMIEYILKAGVDPENYSYDFGILSEMYEETLKEILEKLKEI